MTEITWRVNIESRESKPEAGRSLAVAENNPPIESLCTTEVRTEIGTDEFPGVRLRETYMIPPPSTLISTPPFQRFHRLQTQQDSRLKRSRQGAPYMSDSIRRNRTAKSQSNPSIAPVPTSTGVDIKGRLVREGSWQGEHVVAVACEKREDPGK